MASRRVPESPKKKPVKPVKAVAAAASAPKVRKPRKAAQRIPSVSEDERRGMIAYSAYLRGERRGFAAGGEAQDWLLAEQEVDALLNAGLTKAQ